MRTKLRALVERLAYYEWAYGRLAEADSDFGPVAEYLIGSRLDRLPKSRRVDVKYDLVLSDGRIVEVKAISKRNARSDGHSPICRWDVGTQMASRETLADVWYFLISEFPAKASTTSRFDVFDPRNWKVGVAKGITRFVNEATLRHLGVEMIPRAELGKKRSGSGTVRRDFSSSERSNQISS